MAGRGMVSLDVGNIMKVLNLSCLDILDLIYYAINYAKR